MQNRVDLAAYRRIDARDVGVDRPRRLVGGQAS